MHDGIDHMTPPPGQRHLRQKPLGKHTPPQNDGQGAGGTHPSGMHSCNKLNRLLNLLKTMVVFGLKHSHNDPLSIHISIHSGRPIIT